MLCYIPKPKDENFRGPLDMHYPNWTIKGQKQNMIPQKAHDLVVFNVKQQVLHQ